MEYMRHIDPTDVLIKWSCTRHICRGYFSDKVPIHDVALENIQVIH